MIDARLAIPSVLPGGLDAQVGAHFGRCDVFTLVDIREGRIASVEVLANLPHEQGGCLAPVNLLADRGVTALVAGGMGMRPLMGFRQAGIEVYRNPEAPTVAAAVQALLQGGLQPFSRESTCGSGHKH